MRRLRAAAILRYQLGPAPPGAERRVGRVQPCPVDRPPGGGGRQAREERGRACRHAGVGEAGCTAAGQGSRRHGLELLRLVVVRVVREGVVVVGTDRVETHHLRLGLEGLGGRLGGVVLLAPA